MSNLEITSVKFERLSSTGNYENIKVGGEATVPSGVPPEETLAELRSWVDNQVAQVRQEKPKQELCEDISRLQRLEATLQAKVEILRKEAGLADTLRRVRNEMNDLVQKVEPSAPPTHPEGCIPDDDEGDPDEGE